MFGSGNFWDKSLSRNMGLLVQIQSRSRLASKVSKLKMHRFDKNKLAKMLSKFCGN